MGTGNRLERERVKEERIEVESRDNDKLSSELSRFSTKYGKYGI